MCTSAVVVRNVSETTLETCVHKCGGVRNVSETALETCACTSAAVVRNVSEIALETCVHKCGGVRSVSETSRRRRVAAHGGSTAWREQGGVYVVSHAARESTGAGCGWRVWVEARAQTTRNGLSERVQSVQTSKRACEILESVCDFVKGLRDLLARPAPGLRTQRREACEQL